MTDDIYKIIEKLQVIPVVAFNEVRLALPLADALEEGGLPIVEVTFRTHAAANAIYKIAKERPGVTVGAGTILTITQLKKAVDCGAKFGFAPGFNPKIVEESLKINFPFSPGVMTPSDIEGALSI